MDVSCFLVVEGSADSDEDHPYYHHFGMKKSSYSYDQLETNDVVIDDAESCSCDEPADQLDHLLYLLSHHQPSSQDDEDVVINEEESLPSRVNIEEEDYNSKLIISREIMDRMEDSLFWETCIAVGYPSLRWY
ncbi:hypothetical protein LINGRAHAP2_LOCUS19781 [Linum grandiflorum]